MRRVLLALLALLLLPAPAYAEGDSWMSAWSAPTSSAFPIGYNTDLTTRLRTPGVDRTVRMVVRPTADGRAVRVRLSNALSAVPLQVGSVRVAHTRSRAATTGPGRAVHFTGRRTASVGVGATLVSDPVPMRVRRGHDLTVSVFLPGVAANPSVHSQAFQTTWVSADGSGDHTADTGRAAFGTEISSFIALDRLDVLASAGTRSVVVLGDSLTDGIGTTFDGRDRWTDALARRLRTSRAPIAIANAGLSGNALDCAVGLPEDGPDGLVRLRRDVLSAPGLDAVWVFEGTNDLANACSATEVLTSLRTIARLAHRRGLPIVVSTLLPRIDLHFPAFAERRRTIVNTQLRKASWVDLLVDFDHAVRARDGGWDPAYDSGDQVHLNPAGYRRLAGAVPIRKLARLTH